MEKSNLRSNFTPEVVLWPFLRMRTKSGQNGLKPENSGYRPNQRCASKTAKETLMQCDVRCNSM